MKKIIIASLVIIGIGFGFKIGGWGGITVSGIMPELSALNTEITDVNYREVGGTDQITFTNPFLMVGGHGYGQVGQVVFGGGGAGFAVREKGDSLSARIGYGFGYGEVGFQFEPLNWLWIRPMLSLGGSGFEIELNERVAGFGEPPDDTLYVPYHHLVTAGAFNAGAALAVNFNLHMTSATFIGVELKGGYQFPLYVSDWFDQDGLIRDEVEGFGIYGPYAQVSVNFGRSGEVDLIWDETDDEWDDF